MDRETELARLIKGSDRKAFNSLFDLCWEPMYTYAASLLQDDTVAEDLLQEVWLDYWKRREDIQTDNVKGYLYKAVRYKCYNYLRNNKIPTTLLETASSIAIEPTVTSYENLQDLSLQVETILAKLPPRCQEIFTLSRINQLDNREIAAQLNISSRTVENQLSVALRKLRKELAIVRLLALI